MRQHTRTILLAIAAATYAGCSANDATVPTSPGIVDSTPVTEASLRFLTPAAGSVLRTDSVSFWAVKGQNREVAMWYRPSAGSTDSVRFLRFKVANESLLKRPDGTTFATGDSVKITVRILDFSKLTTQFLPSGLQFSTAKPAELRLDFKNADQDYNRDGVVNQTDANLIATFAIWKQEAVGQPWFKLTSSVEVSSNLSEVKADITSFTNHAIAW
jgi:hypothetical protein